MGWLDLRRTPELEVMAAADEVDAYTSAAAQKYLNAIDDTLVEQALALGMRSGVLLDVGTGPGNIPRKLLRRSPALHVVGVDLSPAMIRAAREAARREGLAPRASFLLADAARLPFAAASFDSVISNSLLHHLTQPAAVFDEMARVVKPGGRILLRDLRRPGRLAFRFHVAWFGRYYSGLMKTLYVNSVRAAYTGPELRRLLDQSRLAAAQVFFHGGTHLGFVWEGRKDAGP
jgi:ubiquinone/menaquinone biosynthesis C-methylase UbiE